MLAIFEYLQLELRLATTSREGHVVYPRKGWMHRYALPIVVAHPGFLFFCYSVCECEYALRWCRAAPVAHVVEHFDENKNNWQEVGTIDTQWGARNTRSWASSESLGACFFLSPTFSFARGILIMENRRNHVKNALGCVRRVFSCNIYKRHGPLPTTSICVCSKVQCSTGCLVVVLDQINT